MSDDRGSVVTAAEWSRFAEELIRYGFEYSRIDGCGEGGVRDREFTLDASRGVNLHRLVGALSTRGHVARLGVCAVLVQCRGLRPRSTSWVIATEIS